VRTFINDKNQYLLTNCRASGKARKDCDDYPPCCGQFGQRVGSVNVSEKVRDLDEDEFVAQVLAKDEDLAKQVQENEIDAEAIIKKAKPAIDKYGIATGIAFAVARLKEAVLEATSETIKGLLVGQRDRFGTNSPVRIPVLSSTGNHIDVINWGTSVKYGDSKIEIPFPSVATLKVINEGEYKGVPNIRLVAMDSYEELSVSDVVTKLNKIAKSVGEIDGGDELRVVVVKGKIKFINPATKWKDKEKDGSWQIYMPNQKDAPVSHPVMQISLENEGGNQVRAVFDRQRNAVPTIAVEDFVELCIDAVAYNSDPVEQAKFLGELVRGRDVIIVGFMTKYTPQANINYIDIGAYAMYDGSPSTQASLEKTKPEGKSAAKKPASTGKPASAGKPAPATKTAPAGKAKVSPADKLKDKIRSYVEIFGVTMNDIDADGMIEHFKLEGVLEKGTVETVIEELRAE
jgi:hypothetical protein